MKRVVRTLASVSITTRTRAHTHAPTRAARTQCVYLTRAACALDPRQGRALIGSGCARATSRGKDNSRKHTRQLIWCSGPPRTPRLRIMLQERMLLNQKMNENGDAAVEEDIVVVEPTDPDEDRMKAAAAAAAVLAAESAKPEIISVDVPTNGLNTSNDPNLLAQILQALAARTTRQPAAENTYQSPPRFIVASSPNNVVTIQTPVQATGGAVSTPSFMVQSLNGQQAARLLNLPSTQPVMTSTAVAAPATQIIQPPNVQQLLTINPNLSGVLGNCVTANLITQVANSISASMLSFAQSVAVEKVTNPAAQAAEISQLLAVLMNLAGNLSNALTTMVPVKSPPPPPPMVSMASPILTSLIAQPPPVVPPVSVAPSPAARTVSATTTLAELRALIAAQQQQTTTVPTMPPPVVSAPLAAAAPPNIVCPIPCQPIPETEVLMPTRTQPPGQPNPEFTTTCLHTSSGAPLTTVKPNPREKQLTCPFSGCTRGFISRFSLLQHRRLHSGEKPFVCTRAGCKKRFKRRHLLVAHAKKHSEEKTEEAGKAAKRRYGCFFAKCDKSFATQNGRNRHMSKHIGVGPFYCTNAQCNVKYFCASDLQRHMSVHEDKQGRKHPCSYGCGKFFASVASLWNHISRFHAEHRLYRCDHPGCGLRFPKLHGLKRHKVTHAAAIRKSINEPLKTIALAPAPQAPITQILQQVIPTTSSGTSGVTEPPKILVHTIAQPGVKLKTILAAQNNTGAIKPDPDAPTQINTTSTGTVDINTITTAATTRSSTWVSNNQRIPLIQRSPKAAATPSATALAEKAIVVAGPYGKRRHICPMVGCTKIFPKLNKLREHICRHTGERPYACSECPATFVRMYDLRRHAMIHQRKRGVLVNGTTA